MSYMGPRGRSVGVGVGVGTGVDTGAGAGAGGNIKLASEGTTNLTLFLAVAGVALQKRQLRFECSIAHI